MSPSKSPGTANILARLLTMGVFPLVRSPCRRCAYFWYFALILGGIGCLVGWYIKSEGCIAQTEQCLVDNDVTSEGFLTGFDVKVS